MNVKLVTNGVKNSSHPIVIGLVYTMGIVFVLTLLFALILYFTSLSDSTLPIISYIVTAVALLFGGYQAGKKAESKGWYYGGLVGIIYGIVLAMISYLGFAIAMNLKQLSLVVLAFLFGAFGGMIGVNTKNK